MTYLLKLSGPVGATPSWDIDITNMNPTFSYRYQNPVIQVPTPAESGDVVDEKDRWAVVTININMSASMVTLKFKEVGGLTTSNGMVNTNNPTTVYERMLRLCAATEKKRLFINDTTSEFAEVAIISYTADIQPGSKDIVEHSVTLILSSTMGD